MFSQKLNQFMYHLYVIRCADGTLYTGTTVDLKRRVQEHNSSKQGAKYTRARRPVKLVYSKKYRNRSVALKAEHALKHLPRATKMMVVSEQRHRKRRRA